MGVWYNFPRKDRNDESKERKKEKKKQEKYQDLAGGSSASRFGSDIENY